MKFLLSFCSIVFTAPTVLAEPQTASHVLNKMPTENGYNQALVMPDGR